MQLSRSGRVLIVDDKYEEVKPLIDSLYKNSIPVLYYDGKVENLPGSPVYGIRFVFLDIELQGMSGQDSKTKASGLSVILRRLITPNNGPYIIIFWTRHKEVIPLVIENCKSLKIEPIWYELMDKYDYLKSNKERPETIECDLAQLTDSLEQKLETIRPFQLYANWEDVVNDSCTEFVNEMSSIVGSNTNWSKDTSFLFYKLYKAVVDKNLTDDQSMRLKCACHLMNRGFMEILERKTANDLRLPNGMEIQDGPLNSSAKAKINSLLHITKTVKETKGLGYVFAENNASLQKNLADSIFTTGQSLGEIDIKLCSVVITPACDIAQNKLIKTEGNTPGEKSRFHRIIYGLIFKNLPGLNLRDEGRDARFDIKPIWVEDKEMRVVFHFGTLTSIKEFQLTGQFMFALKSDILSDLQSKAANHVNRIGSILLE